MWYSFLAVVKMGFRVLMSKITKKPYLVNLIISVTDRCDASCKYCGIPKRGLKELSLERIITLLDEFKKMGGSRVALWGGEPLVREDISLIIKKCKERGFLTSLDTNGHLIPLFIDSLRELDVCVVSLDGDEKSHDASRGKGSYAKTITGIETAVKNGIKVWTITVLNKNNLSSIEHVLKLAEEMKFSTTWQILHHQNLASSSAKDYFPSNEEYRRVIKKLILFKKKGRPIVNSISYFRYLLKWTDYHISFTEKPVGEIKCEASRLYANVDTDGKVYPCSVLVGMVPAISILNNTLSCAVNFLRQNKLPCQACTAGCYIEYNHLYSLNIPTIINWFKYIVLKK